jgi:hypothetical protein
LQGVALRYGMILNLSATFAIGKQFTERQQEFTKPQVSIHERKAFNSLSRTLGVAAPTIFPPALDKVI